MEPQEYVNVVSRTGHFNWIRPEEESVSTHIAVIAPDGKTKMYCNIRTLSELSQDIPIEYLITEIDLYLKNVGYTTDEKEIRAVREYLKEHEDTLTIGNLQQEKARLENRRVKLDERIAAIDRNLALCEEVRSQ